MISHASAHQCPALGCLQLCLVRWLCWFYLGTLHVSVVNLDLLLTFTCTQLWLAFAHFSLIFLLRPADHPEHFHIKERKTTSVSNFQSSACIMSANISMAKENYMVMPTEEIRFLIEYTTMDGVTLWFWEVLCSFAHYCVILKFFWYWMLLRTSVELKLMQVNQRSVFQ